MELKDDQGNVGQKSQHPQFCAALLNFNFEFTLLLHSLVSFQVDTLVPLAEEVDCGVFIIGHDKEDESEYDKEDQSQAVHRHEDGVPFVCAHEIVFPFELLRHQPRGQKWQVEEQEQSEANSQ